jgi:acyl-CoA thioesterase YciA
MGIERKAPIPPQGEPTLRVMPMAGDINGFGAVFGGWTMGQLDIAAGLAAMQAAGGKVTTAAADIDFERPLRVGNLVSFYAEVVGRGKTSLEVEVEAWAEQGAATYADGEFAAGVGAAAPFRAAAAKFVYVAIDERGRKRELPRAN